VLKRNSKKKKGRKKERKKEEEETFSAMYVLGPVTHLKLFLLWNNYFNKPKV